MTVIRDPETGKFIETPTEFGNYVRDPDTNEFVWVPQSGGGGVTDHHELTGLDVDDHTQYYNEERGDSRYSLLNHVHTFASLTTKPTTLAGYGITDSLKISTTAPMTVGVTNTVGTGTTAARSNHGHDHGNQNVGTHHAAVTSTVNGFMSFGDKIIFDAIPATYSVISHTHTFASLTSKPTTISGFGITDAVINTRSILSGDGLSGGGNLTANRTLSVVGADSTINVSSSGIKVSSGIASAIYNDGNVISLGLAVIPDVDLGSVVVHIPICTTAPVASSLVGGLLYVASDGSLHYRGPLGTDTKIADS